MDKYKTKSLAKFAIELMKSVLKPGYLYGIGPDGEVYCVEAEIPEPGKAVTIIAAMPKESRT